MALTSRGISLPKKLDEQLVDQARKEDRSVSGVIRQALQLYLATQQSLFLPDVSPVVDDSMASGDNNV